MGMLAALLEILINLLRCRGCARRNSEQMTRVFHGEPKTKSARKMASHEAPTVAPAAVHGLQFSSLSEEEQAAVLAFLRGSEALVAAAASQFLHHLLDDSSLWSIFTQQEFTGISKQQGTTVETYRALRTREICRRATWHTVPCQHTMGAREGSPHVFCRRDHLFVYGGWGRGPVQDLHAGRLTVPLTLEEVPIQSDRPPPSVSYEAGFCVLEDDLLEEPQEINTPFRVAVFGGYLFGGYHGESCNYGILEIRVQAGSAPKAKWVHVDRFDALASHTATFVPPRLAGTSYPEGYVLVFGGNRRGVVTNSVAVLDLDTLVWQSRTPSGTAPCGRNSHRSTLVERSPHGPAILVAGGGTGDDSNGGPPRGGHDLRDSFWLCGLEDARLHWELKDDAVPGAGRGHVACRISSTDTVFLFGGGLFPHQHCSALSDGRSAWVDTAHCGTLPEGRGFGGGCCLPDGTVLIYGGWHRRGGTYRDFWAANVGESKTSFFSKLTTMEAPRPFRDSRVGARSHGDDTLLGTVFDDVSELMQMWDQRVALRNHRHIDDVMSWARHRTVHSESSVSSGEQEEVTLADRDDDDESGVEDDEPNERRAGDDENEASESCRWSTDADDSVYSDQIDEEGLRRRSLAESSD